MNFLFNVNFWGERYSRFFLDYCLPSLLAAGNIPYMLSKNQGRIKYLIYTTNEDAVLVMNSPAYAKLSELVETEIINFEEFDLYNRHKRGTMTQCHSHAIQYANANNYSLLFIWPDTIFSNNALGTLLDLALSGKTNIFVGGLTVHTGSFLEDLEKEPFVDGAILNIPPRELVAIGVRNLSMQSEQWMWNSNYFNIYPSWIFWDVPGEGLLQRPFHMCPILLTPDDRTASLTYDPHNEMALDGNDFLSRALNEVSTVYVIEDSDDFLMVALNDDALPAIRNRFSAIDVALYAHDIFLPYHYSLFAHKLRFHHTELSPTWKMIEGISENVASEIFALLQLIAKFPDYFARTPIRQPKLIENIGSFNIITFEGKYYALAQSLGPINLLTLSEAELKGLQDQKNCFIGSSFAEVKDKIHKRLKFLIVVPKFITSYGQYYIFPLGLGYISSALKSNGYDVYTVNLNNYDEPVSKILSTLISGHNIDIVCSGGLSIHYQKIKDIIDAAKMAKEGIITIVGGGLLSSEPEVIMDGLDITFGVIGEGEQTIVELSEALLSRDAIHSIDGIIYRAPSGKLTRTTERKPIDDLDAIPYPDYDGFGFSDYLKNIVPSDERELAIVDNPRPISLISSRSCPFGCTFCYHPIGKKYRQRSLDSFFTELEHWIKVYNINIVFIMDELFSLQSDRLYEFCARIKPLNIKWVVALTVKGIANEVLNVMRDAGCYLISYGLESGCNAVLKSMKKPIEVSDIINVLELTYSAKLGVQGNFIFGDIAETAESAVETLSLWLKLRNKHYIYMIPIEVYPGTELYQGAISSGKIVDRLKYIEECCPSMNLTQMPDVFYLRVLLLVYILKKSFLTIPATLIDFEPIDVHPIKGQLYKIRVRCPHCSEIVEYSNLAFFDTFMTCCRLCNRRFNIFDTIRNLGIQINTVLAENYNYSELHSEEMRLFLTPDNFDWLLQNNLKLDSHDSQFMAIKLFGNTYLLPQDVSAKDIRDNSLPLFVFRDDKLFELHNRW